MSRTPYTINVQRYICSELSYIRDMFKTHDFSQLPAIVERIQFHAQSMEDALYVQRDTLGDIRRLGATLSDEEYRAKVKALLDEKKG